MLLSYMPARFHRLRTLVIILVFVVCIVYLFGGRGKRGYDIWQEQPYVKPLDNHLRGSNEPIPASVRCSNFPKNAFNDIQIIIKVGAAEVHDKLLAHLSMNTACVHDVLIFSDYDESIGSHLVHDALANLREAEWKNNPNYIIYGQIQAAKRKGNNITRSSQGWKLDKYKFLPMMDITYDMRPQKKWFVFIEADTYVFWDNLFRWLGHLDPEKPLYSGSPVWRSKPKRPPFAHGGSAIVLSRPALKRLVRPRGYDCIAAGCTQYGVEMDKSCCGDEIVADLFLTRGIKMKGFWPMINGEGPATVRYGRDEQWCEPVITMHHITESEQAEIWNWELRRTLSTPVTFESLWEWQQHLLLSRRKNWSILPEGEVFSMDNSQGSESSTEACERACRQKRWCYQWQHAGNECALSQFIRIGKEQLPDGDGNPVISGTIVERAMIFKERLGPCANAHWVRPNPG